MNHEDHRVLAFFFLVVFCCCYICWIKTPHLEQHSTAVLLLSVVDLALAVWWVGSYAHRHLPSQVSLSILQSGPTEGREAAKTPYKDNTYPEDSKIPNNAIKASSIIHLRAKEKHQYTMDKMHQYGFIHINFHAFRVLRGEMLQSYFNFQSFSKEWKVFYNIWNGCFLEASAWGRSDCWLILLYRLNHPMVTYYWQGVCWY